MQLQLKFYTENYQYKHTFNYSSLQRLQCSSCLLEGAVNCNICFNSHPVALNDTNVRID